MDLKLTRALISVSDKTGAAEFARALKAGGVSILSTGGTARHLKEAGIEVTEVSTYTGFPEIMDGRVKTLHPRIHGGILGRGDTDARVMVEHDIPAIDLVVINLYPFRETIARPGTRWDEAIENIDIGGPAMLRAAAKNHDHTAVVVDPARYPALLAELAERDGCLSLATRRMLAAAGFAHTAEYDAAVSAYFAEALEKTGENASLATAVACSSTGADTGQRLTRAAAHGQVVDAASSANSRADARSETDALPAFLTLNLTRVQALRYGENPHQHAALYHGPEVPPGSIAGATLHAGKPLSFNNLADADAAHMTVQRFSEPACVIVKHANPCGVALAACQVDAYEAAWRCDPTSAFGGIIAFNRPLLVETARAMLDRQFIEVVVAPEITPEALALFREKPDIRVLATGPMAPESEQMAELDVRRACGGYLVQQSDALARERAVRTDRVVSRRSPDAAEARDLAFAWQVAAMVKSNAIVYARDLATVGIGAGQMSRVVSARIAGIKAAQEGLAVAGAVMASDAFFPFRDGIDAAAEAGIRAVIQPGGSRRDDEVIAAADEHGIAMIFTGVRHFRH